MQVGRRRALRETLAALRPLEPTSVAVVTSRSRGPWIRRAHRWFPEASILVLSPAGRASAARPALQNSKFDVVIDDVAFAPSAKTIWWMLRQVEEHGAYVSLERGSNLVDRLAEVQAPVDANMRETDPSWARTAQLRGALGEVTSGKHITVARRRGRRYLVDLAAFGDVSQDRSLIDLGYVHSIDSVWVRRQATTPGVLTVQVSNEGTRWIDVAKIKLTGARHVGVGRFARQVWTRHVRLVSPDGVEIRDVEVRALPAESSSTLRHKLAVSQRTDGFGERLNAMVAAIRLARLMGLTFQYSWTNRYVDDALHAIEPAANMFTQEFRDTYEGENDSTNIITLGPDDQTLEELDRRLVRAIGLSCKSHGLDRHLSSTDFPELAENYSREFSEIGFSAQRQAAVDAARELDLDDGMAAIHLRGGDLIVGFFRESSRFMSKAMALPVARAAVRHLHAEGRTVLAVGQEQDVLDELRDTEGVMSINDLAQPTWTSRADKALFDLTVMTRADLMVAATSGFAQQASKISGRAVVNPNDLFSAEQQHRLIIDDLTLNESRYHPLQSAYAWWSAYHVVRHSLDAAEASRLLSAAGRLDPQNRLYPIVEASWFYRDGLVDQGDAVIADRLRAEWRLDRRLSLLDLFAYRRDKESMIPEQIALFEQVADHSAIARLMLASWARVQPDIGRAHQLATAAAAELSSGLLADLDVDLVDAVFTSTPIQDHPFKLEEQTQQIADATAAWEAATSAAEPDSPASQV
ncbi:hypothetical protein J2X11_002304 [Aeromicrobium panaciterrae]|uniref:Uncharacterized protein n=1 Tax=Aeromicrobium panaciterrae TaxID=363861 RepID=A0ABU1UQJ7_9ACTN|nr:hypothetical protein [Aeromicrobium panaciterrae]MDR7087465.1 hypothetical protein [Aeromicrobium panaciterrae]